jgi:multisubunit Na+/H+ antiporter MnhF subunit
LTVETGCLIALLLGGLLPALFVASAGEPGARVVGLDLVAAVGTFCLILLSEVGPGQSYDLILPLVLVPLSFAGTLVFTRLLGERKDRT